jgi:hypothetical protein
MNKPTVICIVGSTKFKQEILGLTQRETLKGNIVINHGFFHHVDMFPISDETKKMLDALMLRKIDIADIVFVCDKNEYVGNSTHAAIEYAKQRDKPIRYFSQEEIQRKAKESRP